MGLNETLGASPPLPTALQTFAAISELDRPVEVMLLWFLLLTYFTLQD